MLHVSRMIEASPGFAVDAIRIAASRSDPKTYFLETIRHYVYAGDTALHVAAAAYQLQTTEELIARQARVRARNRRGAEPIHYAADGIPVSPAGTRTPAFDHRGFDRKRRRSQRVRQQWSCGTAPGGPHACAAAVHALLENRANPTLMNKRGSTPLHLAVQNTGRSDSGTNAAKEQQRQIVELLLQHGATPADEDANGKSVVAAASATGSESSSGEEAAAGALGGDE